MHPVPLNVFQKTQRLWDTLHPYNAAQMAVLSAVHSTTSIESAFNTALADIGLGTFVCAGGRYWIDRVDARHVSLTEVADVDEHLSDQLNRPFDPLVSMPLRPFVSTRGSTQTLGLVYQHWVADSVSIRIVMRAWLSRLFSRPELRPPPVTLDRAGLISRFGPAVAGWSVMGQIAELLGFTKAMRSMRRIEQPIVDHRVRVTTRVLDPGLIGAIRKKSKTAGVTVGDVFLAAAAEACAAFGANTANRRRPNLAMGTIVDLRSRASHLPDNLFSLLLGFMISSFRASDLTDFGQMLIRSRQLRLSQVQRRSAEASQLRMALGLKIVQHMTPRKVVDFYRKRFPVSGGLSNVNLSTGWPATLHPDPMVGYHRISPTGPLLPIVLTPTTLGDQLSLCCTVRSALVSPEQESRLLNAFIGRLRQFANG